MSINTLQEITKKIKEFCDKSAIVNQYLEGDFSLFNSSDWHYPLIFVTPIKNRITNTLIQFIFNVSFIDNCYEKSTLMKILSDLFIIVTELYIYLSDDAENQQYFITLAQPSEFQPFYRGIDNTCGWQGDVTFNLTMNMNVENIRFK